MNWTKSKANKQNVTCLFEGVRFTVFRRSGKKGFTFSFSSPVDDFPLTYCNRYTYPSQQAAMNAVEGYIRDIPPLPLPLVNLDFLFESDPKQSQKTHTLVCRECGEPFTPGLSHPGYINVCLECKS